MLKSRMEVAKLCYRATELIVNRDFGDQVTITHALLAMTIEQPINFNRSDLSHLKILDTYAIFPILH
jgi:hypothetical protein